MDLEVRDLEVVDIEDDSSQAFLGGLFEIGEVFEWLFGNEGSEAVVVVVDVIEFNLEVILPVSVVCDELISVDVGVLGAPLSDELLEFIGDFFVGVFTLGEEGGSLVNTGSEVLVGVKDLFAVERHGFWVDIVGGCESKVCKNLKIIVYFD